MPPDNAIHSQLVVSASDEKIRELIQNSQINDAEGEIKIRLGRNKDDADAWHLWSEAALKSDQIDAAVQMAMNACQAAPNDPEHLNLLSFCFFLQRQVPQALSSLQQSLDLNASQAYPHFLLSKIHLDLDDLEKAEHHAHIAVSMDSENTDNQLQMGLVLKQLHQLERAIQHLKNAVRLAPDNSDAIINLAAIYLETEDLASAQDYLKLLLTLDNEHTEARFLHAILVFKQGDKEEAIIQLNELAQHLKQNGMHESALSCFEKSLEIDDQRPDTLLFCGDTYLHIGEVEKGVEITRMALDIKPDFDEAIMNLLFAINYLSDASAEEIFQEYLKFGKILSKDVNEIYRQWSQSKDPDRRLKIGYISGDCWNQAASKFVLPILENHTDGFEVFAFSNGVQHDLVTDQIKQAVDHWVDVSSLQDHEVAQTIHDKQIDVLIDLSGHTLGNRLKALMRKPAPVQVSWLGYGYTTGLDCMDYFLSDDHFVPEGYENLFTEEIYHLGRITFCYQPGFGVIDVNPLPASTSEVVTLGCVSRSTRLNEHVIKTWSRILNNHPNTRLLLDNQCYSETLIRENLLARFLEQGVDLSRVLIRYSGYYWKIYNEVDIVLDTFPHNSGTTTFDALWMGVPVVSKLDRPSVGRFGASILSAIGLQDWLATDEDEYCRIVADRISNLSDLAALRSSLRERMAKSELCDAVGFTHSMEKAYREMWQRHCKETSQ